MTGIANVDKEYFDAARTLGATSRQLVFRVAIPRAMPSILQGCTQAMSSCCWPCVPIPPLRKCCPRHWKIWWRS